jgi:hypothetical protein
MYSSDNNKVSKSCTSLVTLRNSYAMMHGPMNTRSGIKLYITSESKSGYIWSMIIYYGKVGELKWSENFEYTSKAVQTLCEEFPE